VTSVNSISPLQDQNALIAQADMGTLLLVGNRDEWLFCGVVVPFTMNKAEMGSTHGVLYTQGTQLKLETIDEFVRRIDSFHVVNVQYCVYGFTAVTLTVLFITYFCSPPLSDVFRAGDAVMYER